MCIGLLLSGSTTIPRNSYTEFDTILVPTSNESFKILQDQVYLPHEPITIQSNEDFNVQKFPGTGTENDPYRIEGWTITYSEQSGEVIAIIGTTAYFQIQHNNISGNYNDAPASTTRLIIQKMNSGTINHIPAITLTQVQHGTIAQNIITNVYAGISLSLSDQNTIILNTIEKYSLGIQFALRSNSNLIANNSITHGDIGVYVGNASNNNTMSHNFISHNARGIWLLNDANRNVGNDKNQLNVIEFNTIVDSIGYGIHLSSHTANNLVQSNVLYNNNGQGGQAFDAGQNNIFTSNYWNDWEGDGVYVINGIGNSDSIPRVDPVPGVFVPPSLIVIPPDLFEVFFLILGTLLVILIFGAVSGVGIGIIVKSVQTKRKEAMNDQITNKTSDQIIIPPHADILKSMEELIADFDDEK